VPSELVNYVIRKILITIPLILGVFAFNFLLIHTAPGGPLLLIADPLRMPVAARLAIEREFGLDQPLPEQFLVYVSNILHGNLGMSFYYKEPVTAVVFQRIPATLLLTGTSAILSFVIGTVLGVIAASRPRSLIDRFISGVSMFGYTVPVYWLGIILLEIFAAYYHVLPAGGIHSLNAPSNLFGNTKDLLAHMALPVTTLTITSIAPFALFTRAGMIDALGKDYILTAKAKGAGTFRVLFRHALRNALLSVMTVFGLTLAFVLAGTVLVETVFSWPGVGLLMFQSVLSRDYPVLLGIFLVIAVSVFVANLVTDVVYAFLDPRIAYE
jgi:peptide/nickel transport system permease protein